MELQLQPVSEINVRFLLLCSSPTVGGFFIDSPYCQPLSIAPFIIHLGPQDFFSDFQNHQVVWLQMAFCTCLKSKKNVARFEVSQLQTWNMSFFLFFFLKCFSHFLNCAPCNEKQYLVQATSPLFGYIAIDVYILLVISLHQKGKDWCVEGGKPNTKPRHNPGRVLLQAVKSAFTFTIGSP